MKHIHSDIIKAWADGAKIEFKTLNNEWERVVSPDWIEVINYRIKGGISIKSWNKHKDMILSYWEGKEIECRLDEKDTWDIVKKPIFGIHCEYRVKSLEPVYFYQWEKLFDENQIIISNGFITDERAKNSGITKEQGWRKIESSRRTWDD